MAFVLKGQASPSLLETYNLERQPVNAFTVDQATARFHNRIDHVQPPVAEEANLTVELGYRYPKGAIVRGEGEDAGKGFESPVTPSGTAGSRFPHVFLKSGGKHVSTLDLIKQNLVLVAAEPTSPWVDAAKAIAILDSYEIHESSSPLQDAQGTLRTKCKLGDGEALLIRPDGFIAWRAEARRDGHANVLNDALRVILGN